MQLIVADVHSFAPNYILSCVKREWELKALVVKTLHNQSNYLLCNGNIFLVFFFFCVAEML